MYVCMYVLLLLLLLFIISYFIIFFMLLQVVEFSSFDSEIKYFHSMEEMLWGMIQSVWI
jgi:hypothetical protein